MLVKYQVQINARAREKSSYNSTVAKINLHPWFQAVTFIQATSTIVKAITTH